MTGTRAQLIDRVKYRFVDYGANHQPFHITSTALDTAAPKRPVKGKSGINPAPAANEALSPAVLPLTTSGAFVLLEA
jgi:hypothetical protein